MCGGMAPLILTPSPFVDTITAPFCACQEGVRMCGGMAPLILTPSPFVDITTAPLIPTPGMSNE